MSPSAIPFVDKNQYLKFSKSDFISAPAYAAPARHKFSRMDSIGIGASAYIEWRRPIIIEASFHGTARKHA